MKILQYTVNEVVEAPWSFSPVQIARVNLLVGNTATGKTRFLNTLFNLRRFVVNKEPRSGDWEIEFTDHGIKYRWNVLSFQRDQEEVQVHREYVARYEANGDETVLVERDNDTFRYKTNVLPKLNKGETSISLLKDEDDIRPIYEAFTRIKRRQFSLGADQGILAYEALPFIKEPQRGQQYSLEELSKDSFSLNVKFFYLKKFHQRIFNSICSLFMEVFPFIKEIDVKDAKEFAALPVHVSGVVPVISFREANVSRRILQHEISSGMKKMLLFITDMMTMPSDSMYLIDEYENSLGLNAIQFFPELIENESGISQYIITSHHPYIIGNIPIQNWYVFTRKGSRVAIKYGAELADRYGKSKQQAFTQLINDSYFLEGVE